MPVLNLEFHYALRSPTGLYYTGRVNSDSEPDAWLGPKHKAFTYTEKGAHVKKDNFACFRSFTVERVS